MRRKIPSTAALTAFDAAARHTSYTEAARELSLSQGAVCRQIAGLEAFLGVELFRRSRRGVVLTDAGMAYHRQIGRRLEDMERDTLDLMARQGRGGALELGVVPTFGTRWLVPRLADFAREHPDVTVHIASRPRPFLFEDSGLDAAIYAGDGNWPGARAIRLMDEQLVAVCSPRLIAPRKRLQPVDLCHLPLLQQATRPDAWRQWFESAGVSADNPMAGPRYELFSMSMEAAACGLGVALVPSYVLGEDMYGGRLVTPVRHAFASGSAYYLVAPERKIGEPVLMAFAQWLQGQTQVRLQPHR